jgi:hypothetical protein
MSKSESFNAEIGRRQLLQAATVLAVVPTAISKAAADAATRPPTSAPTASAPPTSSTGAASSPLFWTTQTASGRVMGIANGEELKGIPYGAPTGGFNR